jgi:hypothetical protein
MALLIIELIPKGWGSVPDLVADDTIGDCISPFVSQGRL